MDALAVAIENLEAFNKARVDAQKEGGQPLTQDQNLELCRDIILADIARRACVDHQRLVQVQAMLAFIMKKNVVEGRRRPSPAEASALGQDVANLVVTRSWLEEFEAEMRAAQRGGEKDGPAKD